ncbi:hypothetical protein J7E63_13085 [Bacillus sp. ISL-75]|uniref:hypothetical protein n=1 Tax=Bacillus sp. ISL-75 TaxID=2819137 RepID=UPI001BECCE66|nr:hypothetical protein [Bacillus sp. ISL-75]MBT2727874.1 hypothetical protein [Bacillus sp. ISL-75]
MSYREIENPMVIDAHWEHLEKPKTFGECAGCEEDIVAGDAYYEIRSSIEVLKVHQKAECCQQYVAEMAWCQTAGEE